MMIMCYDEKRNQILVTSGILTLCYNISIHVPSLASDLIQDFITDIIDETFENFVEFLKQWYHNGIIMMCVN